MTKTGKSLDVFFEDDLVGHVYDTSPLSFEYTSQWIQRRAIQIANIKLAADKSDDASVSAYFENLLPEGQLRTLLLSARNQHQRSTSKAQDKATIALFGDGVPRLGVGTSPSTHILKPDIRNIDGVWASAVNETRMMKKV